MTDYFINNILRKYLYIYLSFIKHEAFKNYTV